METTYGLKVSVGLKETKHGFVTESAGAFRWVLCTKKVRQTKVNPK